MLILNRKVNESIVIDSRITIVVTKVRHGEVGLEVTAPRGASAHTEEYHKAIKRIEKRTTNQPNARLPNNVTEETGMLVLSRKKNE